MADILKTLIPAGGGDYTLMSVAEATDQQNLVTGGNTYTLECYRGTITDKVSWAGWTTGDGNGITIKAAVGEGHGGVAGAGFIIESADSFGEILDLNMNYVVCDGIEARGTRSGSSTANIVRVQFGATGRSLISSAPGATGGPPNMFLIRGFEGTLINCLAFFGAGQTRGVGFRGSNNSGGIPVLENCTAIGGSGDSCFYLDNTPAIVINCVGIGSTNDDFFNFSYDPASTNNASGDASAPGSAPQTGVVVTDGVDFVSPSTGDYSPTPTGKIATTGFDLSADFTTDITGATRTVPWTIGAYIVAGGPPPVGIQEMYIKDGGIFVKYTPYVKVGGAFQEVDAYVLNGGAWVPVHEK